jgi:hypothetical protein
LIQIAKTVPAEPNRSGGQFLVLEKGIIHVARCIRLQSLHPEQHRPFIFTRRRRPQARSPHICPCYSCHSWGSGHFCRSVFFPARSPLPAASHAHNSAVQQCVAAYRQAQAAAGGPRTTGARDAAEKAFRNALPDISDHDSAADFLACILKGMILHISWTDAAGRLIAGAKTALAAFPSKPATSRLPGRPSKHPATPFQ